MRIPLLVCSMIVMLPAALLQARVVTVNVDQVFSEYQQTKLADQELQRRIETFRQEQAESVALYQQMQQEFNQFREEGAKVGLSEAERRTLAEKAAETINRLRTMEQELQQAQQNFQRDVEEQGRRLRQRIVDEIRARIEVLSKERGWLIVMDASASGANGVPVVLYAAVESDVTREVIQSLNSTPAAAPATAPAPAAP
jgi:outer membrane protein